MRGRIHFSVQGHDFVAVQKSRPDLRWLRFVGSCSGAGTGHYVKIVSEFYMGFVRRRHFSPARQGRHCRHNGCAYTARRNRLPRSATLVRWIAAESQTPLITAPSRFIVSDDSLLVRRFLRAAASIAGSLQLIPLFSTLCLSLRMPDFCGCHRIHCNFHICSFQLQYVTLRLRFGILLRLPLLRPLKLPVVETVALLYCMYVINIQTVWLKHLTPS